LLTRKYAKSIEGFVLGGRALGPWLTAFAYGTSYFSAVVFIGYAGQFGWKYGLSATWIGIGNALIGSLLAWVLLGKRTRIMTKKLRSATMPEFFGSRFDSRALKLASSVIVFVFLIPYTSSVYTGLAKLFEMAFNIDYGYCIAAMAVLTAVYVILGGYIATSVNDLFQGIIMLFGIAVVIISALNGQGGLTSAVSRLAQEGEGLTKLFGPDPISLIGVVILTSLGTWGLPQMVHKFYTIKDDRSVKTGAVISTVFAIVIAGGSYFLGGFGRLFSERPGVIVDGIVKYDSIIPAVLSGLSDVIIGIVVILVLSASMSTLSSLVMTSSSTLTLDLIDGFIIKNMGDKQKLCCMRILIAVFVALSVAIAVKPPMFIAQLMGVSWGALAGSFLGPFMYGLYSKKATRGGVWAGFATGVGITLLSLFIRLLKIHESSSILEFLTTPINAGALAMLLSLVVVPVFSAFTKKLPSELTESIFECYNDKTL
jgi:SSS family solute:Na+ symporter